MSAQIIPFDPEARRQIPVDIQAAWDRLDEAVKIAIALREDPSSTSDQRRDATLRALRLQRAFAKISERL